MARYDSPQTEETWEIDSPKEITYGFPKTFPFIFDRKDNRYSFASDETWANEVS